MHTTVLKDTWRSTHACLNQVYSRPKRDSLSRLLGLLASLVVGLAGSITPFSWAESGATTPDAREILTRGTVEAGGAVGFWQAFTFPSENHSANRDAIFIMLRIGMVVNG